MGIKKSVQGLDLFSLPFQFSLGEQEKEKKTFFGGVLSLLIIILSLSYFVYLCYLYGANKMQPSIAVTEQYTSEDFTINLKSDFISLKIQLANGQSLWEYQTDTKTVLLHAMLQYVYEDANKQQQIEYTLGVPCQSSSLQGHLCFSLPSFKNEIPLTFNEKKNINDPLLLILTKCSNSYLESGQTCETDTTLISNILLGINASIEVYLNLNQYKTATKSFSTNSRVEFFILDPAITFYSKLNLQKSDITVSDGFIIQGSEDTRLISGYSRTDSAMTSSFINTQLGIDSYGGISFNLGPNNILVNIQFPQFTQLLAQFASIFNTLLILGFFGKLLAESEIAQEMISVQLKHYYKLTANKLISFQSDKSCKEREQVNNEPPASRASSLLGAFNKISNLNFQQTVSKQLHISFPRRIYSFLFQSDTAPKDSPELKIYKQLQQQASNAFNIFQLQKEILTLKVMLRLTLSPEQFAAALLCGSNLPVDHSLRKQAQNKENPQQIVSSEKKPMLDQELVCVPRDTVNNQDEEIPPIKQKFQSEQDGQEQQAEEINLNHLEQIDQIEANPLVQEQYLLKFLQSRSDSEINTRINECMIRSQMSETFQIQMESPDKKPTVPPLSGKIELETPLKQTN